MGATKKVRMRRNATATNKLPYPGCDGAVKFERHHAYDGENRAYVDIRIANNDQG